MPVKCQGLVPLNDKNSVVVSFISMYMFVHLTQLQYRLVVRYHSKVGFFPYFVNELLVFYKSVGNSFMEDLMP